MPFKTFAFLIVCVIAAAALTIAAVTNLVPGISIAVLAVISMAAALIVRKLNG